MTLLKHAVEIGRPIEEVYARARQVERYPEFMKDYLYSRLVCRTPEGDLVERAAMVRGRKYVWKSLVTFQENQGVYFVHQEGPLHGMQVSWTFDALAPGRTRLTITHRFRVRSILPLWGLFIEKWKAKPSINDIAGRVVVSFKAACEAEQSVAA